MDTVKDIATRFNVSRETARIWAKEFARYLSPGANPAKGNQRNFGLDDLPIFALIADMKEQGNTYEDIHVALQSGQRGAVPLTSPPTVGDGKISLSSLQRDISFTRAERDDYQARMLKAEGAADELREQVQAKDTEIARLNREIGRLEVSQGDSE